MIWLDTETTGIKDARLVELSYKKDNGPIITIRCKPVCPIEIEASVVNGISNDDVKNLPLFRDMPEYQWIKDILESDTVVAHNATFDVSVLEREGIHVKSWTCSKALAQVVFTDSPKHNLQYLRFWLNLKDCGDAHTSAGDVRTLYSLWQKLSTSSPLVDSPST